MTTTTATLYGYKVTRRAALPATEDATGVLLGEYELTGPRGATYYTMRQPGMDVFGFLSLVNCQRTIRIGGHEWLPVAEVEAAAR